MRRRLLGEDHPLKIRPLNDNKAIDSGANFISEAFIFSTAALIILGESYRSHRKESLRRDEVKERLDEHDSEIKFLKEGLELEREGRKEGLKREVELEKIVGEIVGIGLRGG